MITGKDIALSDRYSNFRIAYQKACDQMYAACIWAFDFYEQDGKKFREYCTDCLRISEATFSKMVKSGEIIKTNPGIDFTGMEYSKIYQLKDVQGELDNFASFVDTSCKKDITELTQREIKKQVKDFYDVIDDTELTVVPEEHPQTKATFSSLWDEMEDAIINSVGYARLLELFYKLKEEVTSSEE